MKAIPNLTHRGHTKLLSITALPPASLHTGPSRAESGPIAPEE